MRHQLASVPSSADLITFDVVQVNDKWLYLVVNAGCRDKDLQWIEGHLAKEKVSLEVGFELLQVVWPEEERIALRGTTFNVGLRRSPDYVLPPAEILAEDIMSLQDHFERCIDLVALSRYVRSLWITSKCCCPSACRRIIAHQHLLQYQNGMIPNGQIGQFYN